MFSYEFGDFAMAFRAFELSSFALLGLAYSSKTPPLPCFGHLDARKHRTCHALPTRALEGAARAPAQCPEGALSSQEYKCPSRRASKQKLQLHRRGDAKNIFRHASKKRLKNSASLCERDCTFCDSISVDSV